MNNLSGQHAVVTGGGRGIGRTIAEAFIADGAHVTIMGRNAEKLQAAADEMGAQAVTVDVTQPDSVSHAFVKAASVLEIDILVNNAGAAHSAPFHRMEMDLWQHMLSVNLTGTFLCTQAVIGSMRERGYGRIVNVASTAGLRGYPYVTGYSAAKHGVIGLTRSLALELAKKSITVNAVCPGYTDTDMATEAINNIVEKTGRTEEEAIAELVKHNPQGRMIQPEEVAEAVLWLCQKSSGSITGQSIAVAGGEVL